MQNQITSIIRCFTLEIEIFINVILSYTIILFIPFIWYDKILFTKSSTLVINERASGYGSSLLDDKYCPEPIPRMGPERAYSRMYPILGYSYSIHWDLSLEYRVFLFINFLLLLMEQYISPLFIFYDECNFCLLSGRYIYIYMYIRIFIYIYIVISFIWYL